jgi:hypothetical protein
MNQDRIAEPNQWERREDEYDQPEVFILTLNDEERRKFIATWQKIASGPVRLEILE